MRWVVHIPFVGIVKFKYLAHFPEDQFADPGVSSLVLLLSQFAAFANYVIDGFISVIAGLHLIFCCVLSIIALLLLLLLFRVFHISISWGSFTGVRGTASLLKSPQVSSTLLSILAILHNVLLLLLLLYSVQRFFFPSALSDGFPLESEWQHVSSSLLDSS